MPAAGTPERAPFGALIRHARKAQKWRIIDVVDRTGIGRTTLIRWESGETTEPKPREVAEVADALGIDRVEAFRALGWLADDSEPEPELSRDEMFDMAIELMGQAHELMNRVAEIDEQTAGRHSRTALDIPSQSA
jgi:transcriptional regulator with XRE-family HTH domain